MDIPIIIGRENGKGTRNIITMVIANEMPIHLNCIHFSVIFPNIRSPIPTGINQTIRKGPINTAINTPTSIIIMPVICQGWSAN